MKGGQGLPWPDLTTSVPFAATRTHLLSAVAVCGMARCSGVWGRPFSRAQYFSGHVIRWRCGATAHPLGGDEPDLGALYFGPVWLGLARYTLAGVGFAALFAVRPNSQPLAVWLAVARAGVAIGATVLATT